MAEILHPTLRSLTINVPGHLTKCQVCVSAPPLEWAWSLLSTYREGVRRRNHGCRYHQGFDSGKVVEDTFGESVTILRDPLELLSS
jgi:hypothetical protein